MAASDVIQEIDWSVGQVLEALDRAGMAEDTIVFFYSDHGAGLPRGKRVLQDSGTKVPLLIRFPEKYRHLAPAAPGETLHLTLVWRCLEQMEAEAALGGGQARIDRQHALGKLTARERIERPIALLLSADEEPVAGTNAPVSLRASCSAAMNRLTSLTMRFSCTSALMY